MAENIADTQKTSHETSGLTDSAMTDSHDPGGSVAITPEDQIYGEGVTVNKTAQTIKIGNMKNENKKQ